MVGTSKDTSIAGSGSTADLGSTLDTELAVRLKSLGETTHANSERMGSSRPVVIEAMIWIAIGVVIWIAALMYFN